MTTPGQVLAEEFMAPLGLSARRLAEEMGVPANRVTGIVAGTRRVTARTAIRLAKRLGTSAEFWMHLQVAVDLARAGYQRPVRVKRERSG